MKKNIIIATLVAASALLASISCTKQDDVQSVSEAKVFTATIEQELTKTMLKDDRVYWDEKDLININGARYSATPNRDKPESATFTFVDGIAPTAPYRAIYPASLWDNGKYFFPPVQNYSEGKFNAPMYAESSSEKLTFNNICGVICLKLLSSDDSETVVRRIVLTTKEETVWGEFHTNTNIDGNWEAYVSNEEDQSNTTVTLDCGEDGISLNPYDAKEFFIYLPPQHYQSGMTVSIESTNPDCSAYEMHTNYEVSVDCNSVYSFNWTVQFVHYVPRGEAPAGGLSHLFTVGPNETDKVYFSKGNLRALYNSGLSWSFAENQYDFIGYTSGNQALMEPHSLYDNNVIDLFRWSVEGNDYGVSSGSLDNPFRDWGSAIDGNVWRTLSGGEGGEWEYLLDKREVNGNTGAGYSYELIKGESISGKTVTGVAIFPDGFTNQDLWKTDLSTWNEIAQAGIVFLPLAGYFPSWTEDKTFWDDCVHYWSNYEKDGSGYSLCYEPGDDPNNFPAYFSSTHKVPSKADFCAVRLVANAFVPAPPDAPEVIEAEECVEAEQ